MNETVKATKEEIIDTAESLMEEAAKMEVQEKAAMDRAIASVPKKVEAGNSVLEIVAVTTVTIAAEIGLYLLGTKVVKPKVENFFAKRKAAKEEPVEVSEDLDGDEEEPFEDD